MNFSVSIIFQKNFSLTAACVRDITITSAQLGLPREEISRSVFWLEVPTCHGLWSHVNQCDTPDNTGADCFSSLLRFFTQPVCMDKQHSVEVERVDFGAQMRLLLGLHYSFSGYLNHSVSLSSVKWGSWKHVYHSVIMSINWIKPCHESVLDTKEVCDLSCQLLERSLHVTPA